jgi:hypothetical protein
MWSPNCTQYQYEIYTGCSKCLAQKPPFHRIVIFALPASPKTWSLHTLVHGPSSLSTKINYVCCTSQIHGACAHRALDYMYYSRVVKDACRDRQMHAGLYYYALICGVCIKYEVPLGSLLYAEVRYDSTSARMRAHAGRCLLRWGD